MEPQESQCTCSTQLFKNASTHDQCIHLYASTCYVRMYAYGMLRSWGIYFNHCGVRFVATQSFGMRGRDSRLVFTKFTSTI